MIMTAVCYTNIVKFGIDLNTYWTLRTQKKKTLFETKYTRSYIFKQI